MIAAAHFPLRSDPVNNKFERPPRKCIEKTPKIAGRAEQSSQGILQDEQHHSTVRPFSPWKPRPMRFTPRIGLILTTGIFTLVTSHAYADCPKLTSEALSDCRIWPAKPDLTIRATTAFTPDKKADPSGDNGSYDLTLQLQNTADQMPVATYKQAEQWYSDGISLRQLSIDTARYMLSPTIRAFGLRSVLANQSRANPYSTQTLALFVLEGSTLRPVLDGLVMEDQTGEWDSANCTGEGAEHHRTVQIGKGFSHGFTDLVVRTETVRMSAVGQPDACDIKSTPAQVEVTTLHYNGSMYRVAAGMGDF